MPAGQVYAAHGLTDLLKVSVKPGVELCFPPVLFQISLGNNILESLQLSLIPYHTEQNKHTRQLFTSLKPSLSFFHQIKRCWFAGTPGQGLARAGQQPRQIDAQLQPQAAGAQDMQEQARQIQLDELLARELEVEDLAQPAHASLYAAHTAQQQAQDLPLPMQADRNHRHQGAWASLRTFATDHPLVDPTTAPMHGPGRGSAANDSQPLDMKRTCSICLVQIRLV